MASRVARQECGSEVEREIEAGVTFQVTDFILMVLSIMVAWCVSVVSVVGWMVTLLESSPTTAADDHILTPETIPSSEQHDQQQEEPATWHANDLSSEVTWGLNPLALGMGAEEYFDEGYGDMTDIRLFEQACEGECDETSDLPTPSTSRKLQPLSVIPEDGPGRPQTSSPDEIQHPATSTFAADLDQEQPVTWHDNDLASEVTWRANPLALGMGVDEFFGLGYGDLTDLKLYEKGWEGESDDMSDLFALPTPRMLQLSTTFEDGPTRPQTSNAKELVLSTRSTFTEDPAQEPVRWHTNDISSDVEWQLNPLAVDMDVETYFEFGSGGVAESPLYEDASKSVSEAASETRPVLMQRTPQLPLIVSEQPEGLDGVPDDSHVDVFMPLVAMTPSQVNVRDASSPTKLSGIFKLSQFEEEAVPRVDLEKKPSEAEKEAARRRAKYEALLPKNEASEADKETARRRAKYERPFEIWGRTGPNSGLQKWHVTWCPRDATPVRSTPDKQSDDGSMTSAVRVRARQAAAALRHVARRREASVRK